MSSGGDSHGRRPIDGHIADMIVFLMIRDAKNIGIKSDWRARYVPSDDAAPGFIVRPAPPTAGVERPNELATLVRLAVGKKSQDTPIARGLTAR